MSSDMRIQFEKHKGKVDIETNEVTFYGVVFSDILEASKHMKKLPLGPEYEAWYYRGHKGFIDPSDGTVFIDDHWMPDADFAKNLIRTKISRHGGGRY